MCVRVIKSELIATQLEQSSLFYETHSKLQQFENHLLVY